MHFIGLYVIIFIMFCLKYILSTREQKSYLVVEYIDQFIIVKDYVKQVIYSISNNMLTEKKHQPINKKTVREIDEIINNLSKVLCKALSTFSRKDEVLKSLGDVKNNYFLFPDTLLKSYKINYYSTILSICTDITGININIVDNSEHNCKMYISTL